MAKTYDQQPEQNPFLPPDSGLPGGYPPPSSQSFESIPHYSGGVEKSRNRGMDRFLARILTFIVIVAVFVLLVVFLKNISPDGNNQMDITPGERTGTAAPVEEPASDIIGE